MCYVEQWSKEFSLDITLYWNLQLQALHPLWLQDVIFHAPESLLHSRWAHHPQDKHRGFHSVHLCHGTWSHLAVATSQGDVNPSTHRPVLLTGNSQAWVCCTNPLPTRQSQPAHHTEVPVGSSRSCPAILPLMWPGLCLTVRQEILMQTSFLSDSRNDEQSCFLALL